jgi:predicted secreted protein
MRRGLPAIALVVLPAHSALSVEPVVAPAEPTVLHLTQVAERHLPRDLLHVELRAEKTGADPQTVEAAINQNMAKALAQARQVQGVAIETGSYAVYRQSQGATDWTGSQSLFLSGGDAGSLLKLAGALQGQGLIMSNLGSEASPKTVHAAEDALTAEALANLDRRVATIAQQLRLSVAGYSNLTVGNAQPEGGPMPRMAVAAGASMPAPVAASGEATVRVTVTADVLLIKP